MTPIEISNMYLKRFRGKKGLESMVMQANCNEIKVLAKEVIRLTDLLDWATKKSDQHIKLAGLLSVELTDQMEILKEAESLILETMNAVSYFDTERSLLEKLKTWLYKYGRKK